MSIRTGQSKGRHSLLLAGLVAMLVLQPLLGHRSVLAGGVFDAVLSGLCLAMFFVIFESRRERRLAFVLILPAIAGNVLIYTVPREAGLLPEVLYHCSMVAFLGFAVGAIVRNILGKSVISADDVLGAFCGYILLALAWASPYTLSYLFIPAAFSVSPAIVERLAEWHRRRAIFDYLSFTTLMTLGYGEIIPIAPPAYSLTWLEVMVGQFYMAVVVAQLVGLKLAQALRGDGPATR